MKSKIHRTAVQEVQNPLDIIGPISVNKCRRMSPLPAVEERGWPPAPTGHPNHQRRPIRAVGWPDLEKLPVTTNQGSNSSALEAPDPTVACDDDVRFARTKTCGAGEQLVRLPPSITNSWPRWWGSNRRRLTPVTHAGSLACLLTAAAPERTRMHAHGSPRLQLATCTSNHASVTYVLTAVVAVPCPQRWNWWRVPASQVHYAPSNKRRFGYRFTLIFINYSNALFFFPETEDFLNKLTLRYLKNWI